MNKSNFKIVFIINFKYSIQFFNFDHHPHYHLITNITMTIEYTQVLRGHDPTLNVVILEDTAAVLGVLVAASCMACTSYLQTPVPDAIGSLLIGGLLGLVASFVIVTNSGALLGRSISPDRLATINRMLEKDSMVRAIHDVKATDMGNDVIRYKGKRLQINLGFLG